MKINLKTKVNYNVMLINNGNSLFKSPVFSNILDEVDSVPLCCYSEQSLNIKYFQPTLAYSSKDQKLSYRKPKYINEMTPYGYQTFIDSLQEYIKTHKDIILIKNASILDIVTAVSCTGLRPSFNIENDLSSIEEFYLSDYGQIYMLDFIDRYSGISTDDR